MAKAGSLLTTEILERVLDQLVPTPNWRKAMMMACRGSERTAFVWRAKSKYAERDKDTSSIFFLEWRGAYDYWHNHAGRARTENIMVYEATIRDQALNGIEHVVLGPDQRPVYRENPNYIGRDDDYVMLSEGCGPGEVARYRLLLDPITKNPIPLTKIEQIPAPLRLRTLEQDRRYVERKEVDTHVSGEITVAKPLQRLPGEARPDVARLRQLAALPPAQRREAIGASPYPKDANGHRTIATGLPPGKRDDDLPTLTKPQPSPYVAPYVPPQAPEPQPRPDYARPVKSLDSAGTGRGEPPSGGGPANGPGNVR
jgi:hypothetical protein